jgi:hypothetical protein
MLGISHRPDSHLPRVLAALADAGAKDDACDLFPACADFIDATCGGVATLVKLLNPCTEELEKIWHACGKSLDLFPVTLHGEQNRAGTSDSAGQRRATGVADAALPETLAFLNFGSFPSMKACLLESVAGRFGIGIYHP